MLNRVTVYDIVPALSGCIVLALSGCIVPALSGCIVPGKQRAIERNGRAREASLTFRLPASPYPVSYGRHGQRAIQWLQWLIVAAILLRRLWLQIDPARRKAIRGTMTALVVIVMVYAVAGSVLFTTTALGGVDGLITGFAILVGLNLLLVMAAASRD